MRIEVSPTATWADQVAVRLLARLREQPNLTLCLPTGATPRPVYQRVVGGIRAGEASLAGVELFLLDEFGGIPIDDPARCARMIATDLLDHVENGPRRVHVPDVDASDVAAACEAYEDAIAAAGGIDLALLGLGANGHVGMNEPGSAADTYTRAVRLHATTAEHATRSYGASVSPAWGVTMGIGTILEARTLWLLVSGRHKRKVLTRVLRGPIGPEVPASLLRGHDDLVVHADDDAADLRTTVNAGE